MLSWLQDSWTYCFDTHVTISSGEVSWGEQVQQVDGPRRNAVPSIHYEALSSCSWETELFIFFLPQRQLLWVFYWGPDSVVIPAFFAFLATTFMYKRETSDFWLKVFWIGAYEKEAQYAISSYMCQNCCWFEVQIAPEGCFFVVGATLVQPIKGNNGNASWGGFQ